MRRSKAYTMDEMGSLTALHHAQNYLGSISGRSIPLDEDDMEDSIDRTPERILEADTLNSAESYIIPYRRPGAGPETGIEVIDLYDTGEEIVVSGEGRYMDNVERILESDNPSMTSSKEIFSHRLQEGLQEVKTRLGG